MDKKLLASLMMIGIVAAVLGGATYAVFSDTEKSVDNTMTAGTIDFSVDGENPWTTTTWSAGLGDLKPCVVRYGEFTIANVGTNPMNLWKKLTITSQDGGILTEPECVEGGGIYSDAPNEISCLIDGNPYPERCNLASYILYDMTVTIYDANGEPVGDPDVIIDIEDQVRLDNIGGVWISLGTLANGSTMTVNQSYHLSSWDDAPDPAVTNWAQGDVLMFDVKLHGEQITGPGPNLETGTLIMENKNPTTWAPITDDAMNGTLTYNREGPTFNYTFNGVGLAGGGDYSLIYYADPWNSGLCELIDTGTAGEDGALTLTDTEDLGMDLPVPGDTNYPAGAKIWLVPSDDYNEAAHGMANWNHPDAILYEMNLISYDDTDAP